MRVRDIMRTHVVTLNVESTLSVADDIMSMARIRHLPVLDHKGALVGIVTQRDLFRAALSSVLHVRDETQREWLRKIPLHDVMVRDLVTIGPDAGVVEAVERMVDGKLGSLPVVEKGKFTGLITETDCLRAFANMLKAGDFRSLLC